VNIADGRWEEESISLGPPFLRSTQEVDSNRHPLHQIQGGRDVGAALGFLTIEDGDKSIRSGSGWKVGLKSDGG
jgi:hypothetical protein